MGYVWKGKTYRLVFADDEFAGLEVVARSASVGAYRRIADLATREFAHPPSEDDLGEIDNLFAEFAAVLVSWNLEDEAPDGTRTPVPATFEGMASQDLTLVRQIIWSWMEAVAGISGPLEQPSDGGGPSVEESIPMEVLSPSL
ncbi:MAG: hypothetical protein ACM30G_09860 [Micromonosporaceae bacterium]